MLLKTFTIDFQNIGRQEFLRTSVGYRYFFDIQKVCEFDVGFSKSGVVTYLKKIN